MLPDNLVEGQQYVVNDSVEKDGGEHPQLDPGDLVTLINATPDSDGEVYVTATASDDGAAIGAWVKTEYLDEHACDCQDHDDEEAYPVYESNEVIREFSYIPHPEYPNLPCFETLPLGYALGVVQFVKDLGQQKPALTPEVIAYMQARGILPL